MRVAEQTRQWLAFDDKIWLDESHDAVAEGIAQDELVARLALVPAGRSSKVKWRWVVGTIVAALGRTASSHLVVPGAWALRGHSNSVFGVAFSPNSNRLATASQDGTVQIYVLDLRELLNLARSRVTRPFTPEECQRYFQSETCPPLP